METRREVGIGLVSNEHHDSLGGPFPYDNDEGPGEGQAADHDGLGAEEGVQLGCSKCRYSKGGCSRCRNPAFRPRKGSVPRDELAALAGQQRRVARGEATPGRPAKRRRKGRPTQAPPPSRSGSGGLDTLVSQLRRHLGQPFPQQQPSQQQEGSFSAAAGLAERLGQLHTSSSGMPVGGEGLAPAQPQGHEQQQQQQGIKQEERQQRSEQGGPQRGEQEAAPAPGSPAPSDLPGATPGSQQAVAAAAALEKGPAGLHHPAPAGPLRASEREPAAGAAQPLQPLDVKAEPEPGSGAMPGAAPGVEGVPGGPHPAAASRKRAAGEAGEAGQPPPSLQRPAKQLRAGGGEAPLAVTAPAPRNGKRQRSPGAESAASPPPRQFRRVMPQQAGQQGQQVGTEGGQGTAASDAAALDEMDIDGDEYALPAGSIASAAAAAAASSGAPRPAAVQPENGHPAAAAEAAGGTEEDSPMLAVSAEGPRAGSKRSFMSLLEANMEQRRRERRESGGGAAAAALLQAPGAAKRQKRAYGQQGASPASSQGASEVEAPEPDPRLCVWEPPVSPFGLLEEELYDDPWKVLVACMLLNKTTAAQVRKVIWDLFALCPTPAAAVAADVAAIEALITPLGLFRKRAVAIQKLSQDYLQKQWRDPRELYGIGKYAADAYYIFCRGRWREVAPEDKDLLRYLQWLEGTGGLGSGLTRHRTVPVAVPAAAETAIAAAAGAAAVEEAAPAAGWQADGVEAPSAAVEEPTLAVGAVDEAA